MSDGSETAIDRMRQQAERAIASSKSRNTVLPLLERLVRAATKGSEARLFAHRHLAELLVEQHPWRALLHLKEVLGDRPSEDDSLHALAGLAHALLGNYHAAISAYRRAVAIAPRNPWYQHNLGHLLDVGIDRPKLALPHLEAAHRSAGPDDGEISASLAHCLARLGDLTAALAHAEVALTTSPENADHQRLRSWIVAGAQGKADGTDEEAPREALRERPKKRRVRKGKEAAEALVASAPPGAADAAPIDAGPALDSAAKPPPKSRKKSPPTEPSIDPVVTSPSPDDAGSERASSVGQHAAPRRRRSAAVSQISSRIETRMREAGYDEAAVATAVRVWDDYSALLPSATIKQAGDDVWSALAEYAVARRRRGGRTSVATIAARHGIAVDDLSLRWTELERVQPVREANPK